jgi:hypothetical protein
MKDLPMPQVPAQPVKESVKDYPALECPHCKVERAPRSLNKHGSVTYSCPADHKNHGDRFTWRIAVDGNLVEVLRKR